MINFKKIVEVIPDDPRCTLKKLAVEIGESEECFMSIPEEWVKQQKFITAYPYALAPRNWTTTVSPKYAIASLSKEEVDTLEEDFGYEVHESIKKVEESQKNVPVEKKEEKKTTFSINGKSVSEEEFKKEMSKFEKLLDDMTESFGGFLSRL